MSWLKELRRDLRARVMSLVQRDRWEADLDEELRSHLEMEIEHRVARGEDRRSAERSARLALGGVEGIKEECRDSWGSRMVQDLWRDLQGAGRRLVRYRRYSLVVIGSLGLGLGAALVVFSMIDAVLLRPLPFQEPGRLVEFKELTPQGDEFSTSDANLTDFRAQSRTLQDIAATQWPPPRPALLQDGQRMRLEAMGVTPNFFRTLGVTAVHGRTFGAEEERPDQPSRSVVLSHEAWRSLFGGDTGISGRAIDLDGHTWTIIGVLPEGFRFGAEKPQIYLPFRLDLKVERGDHRLSAFARLEPGLSIEAAQAELTSIAQRLAAQYPESNADWGVRLEPLSDAMLGPGARRSQWMLLGAVGLLLLLAWVNVANLLLAQLADRQEELALRRALGSGRWRVLQQILTEAIVLGVLGAAAGLAVAHLVVPWIRGLAVPLPRLDEMTVDHRVAGLAVLLALASGVVFGWLPAWGATRSTDGANRRHQGQDHRAGRLRSTLVASEVALATVLAIGAGLLLDSFKSLAAVESGFESEGVLLAQIDLPREHYSESSPFVKQFYDALVERTEALPGVESAGATMTSPFRGPNAANSVSTESQTEQDAFLPISWRGVTPGLFRTLGIPLLRGSGLSETEARMETVISVELADRLWPGEDPIGRRMRWIGPQGPLFEVVGVVPAVQDMWIGVEPPLMVYMPQKVMGWPTMTLAVRADSPQAAVAPIREIVAELDPKLGPPAFSMLAEQRREALSEPQLSLQVMSAFSLVALLLAAAGVYGVVAYSVSRRRRDLGVRLALGASPRGLVVGLTLRSLAPVLLGLVVGLALALGLAGSLRSVLYETSPFEPRVVVSVVSLLALVGLVSAWLPARRAAGLDPLIALREE